MIHDIISFFLLIIIRMILYSQERRISFFTNTSLRVILFLLLIRRMILYLQEQKITFHKCGSFYFRKYDSLYNIILFIKKNNITFTRMKNHISQTRIILFSQNEESHFQKNTSVNIILFARTKSYIFIIMNHCIILYFLMIK